MTIRMTRRQALEVGGMAAMGLALAAGSSAEGEGDPGNPFVPVSSEPEIAGKACWEIC